MYFDLYITEMEHRRDTLAAVWLNLQIKTQKICDCYSEAIKEYL